METQISCTFPRNLNLPEIGATFLSHLCYIAPRRLRTFLSAIVHSPTPHVGIRTELTRKFISLSQWNPDHGGSCGFAESQVVPLEGGGGQEGHQQKA